ncbi:ATP-binding protein [Kribbella deserti]|uniref:Tetratricopeptide repeat protein n=1 Tax=Kribbella deserti TaxID=1926257 RepID=A0ABV6QQC0_9ACTN
MVSGSTFGDLLRQLRTAADLTQDQLGARAGLSAQTVSTLERGTRSKPRRETVLLIANAFQLSADETEHLLRSSRHTDMEQTGSTPIQTGASGIVPRTLPPVTADFTGRTREAAAVRAQLDRSTGSSGLIVITGMGGVGKTSLALQVAHEMAPTFADGQLYVDLGGFATGGPTSSIDAIAILLGALGVSAADIPADPALAIGRYRSLVADRRILLVLDNALDARHVEPLLPTSAGSAAIITSRRALVVAGAGQIRLDTFTEAEAVAMLAQTSGRSLDEDLQAAKEIAQHCGRLPLALRIVGARLAARPFWSVTAMRDRLADDRRQLDELEHHDLGVRRSLAISIDQLTSSDDERDRQAAATVRLLPSAPGQDFSTEVAAAWIDRDPSSTEHLLERLVDNALLESHSPGRYRFHDLIRAYLRELGAPKDHQHASLTRALRLYARHAWQASDRSWGIDERLTWYDDLTLGTVASFADVATAAAADWLGLERRNLLEAVSAATTEHDALIVQLGIGLMPRYMDLAMQADAAAVNATAQQAAIRLGDLAAQAVLLHDAGAILFETGHPDEGLDRFERALILAREADDHVAEAMVLRNLTHVYAIVRRLDDSIAAGERGLALLRRPDVPPRASQMHMYLGVAHGLRGDTERELACFERAIALVEQNPAEFRRRHNVYKHIGMAHRRADRLEESARLLRLSVKAAEAAVQLPNRCVGLVELARTQLAQDRPAEALDTIQESVEQARAINVQSLEARALYVMGVVLQARGDSAQAEICWRTARSMYEGLGLTIAARELDEVLSNSAQDLGKHLHWYDGPMIRQR